MRNPSPQSENYIDLLFDAIRRADVNLLLVYVHNLKNKYAALWNKNEIAGDDLVYAFYAEYASAKPISLDDLKDAAKIIAFIYQIKAYDSTNSKTVDVLNFLGNLSSLFTSVVFYREKKLPNLVGALATDFNLFSDCDRTKTSLEELQKALNCETEIGEFRSKLEEISQDKAIDSEISKKWLLPLLAAKYQMEIDEVLKNYFDDLSSGKKKKFTDTENELLTQFTSSSKSLDAFITSSIEEIEKEYKKDIRKIREEFYSDQSCLTATEYQKISKHLRETIIHDLTIKYNKVTQLVYVDYFENNLTTAESIVMQAHINHLTKNNQNQLDYITKIQHDLVTPYQSKKNDAETTIKKVDYACFALEEKIDSWIKYLDASNTANKIYAFFSRSNEAHKENQKLIEEKKAALTTLKKKINDIYDKPQDAQNSSLGLKKLVEKADKKREALESFQKVFDKDLPLLQKKNSVIEEQILKAILVIATGVIPGLIGLAVHSKATKCTYAFWRSRCHGIGEEVNSTVQNACSAV